jgi:hypothetical protein
LHNEHTVFVVIFYHMRNQARILTLRSLSVAARLLLSIAVTVLLPTPPFPDSTKILFRTCSSLSLTSWIPGSGPLATSEAQICWLGQPAHADAFPALALSVPGQSDFDKKMYR